MIETKTSSQSTGDTASTTGTPEGDDDPTGNRRRNGPTILPRPSGASGHLFPPSQDARGSTLPRVYQQGDKRIRIDPSTALAAAPPVSPETLGDIMSAPRRPVQSTTQERQGTAPSTQRDTERPRPVEAPSPAPGEGPTNPNQSWDWEPWLHTVNRARHTATETARSAMSAARAAHQSYRNFEHHPQQDRHARPPVNTGASHHPAPGVPPSVPTPNPPPPVNTPSQPPQSRQNWPPPPQSATTYGTPTMPPGGAYPPHYAMPPYNPSGTTPTTQNTSTSSYPAAAPNQARPNQVPHVPTPADPNVSTQSKTHLVLTQTY